MTFIKSVKFFFTTLTIIGLAGLVLLGLQGYNQSFLSLNRLHFAIGDEVFPHLTHLADGVLLTTLMGFLYANKDKAWIGTMAWSLLMMAFVINILKYNVFETWARPPLVLGKEQIHYITTQNECCNTFPSGHSATAVCMFTFFAFQWEKQRAYYGILAGIAAILLGYSRIYIGVHFLGDVLFGSLLGFLLAFAGLQWVYPRLLLYFQKKSDNPLKYYTFFIRLIAVILMIYDIHRIYSIYRLAS